MIAVHVQVVVGADDLEVLVRAYHRALWWTDEDGEPDLFNQCACGWKGNSYQYSSHVEHAVREARAGRILL